MTATGLHVLLVEDNDDDVVQLREILDGSGLVRECTRLGDGEVAIAYLRRASGFETVERPDLVMLDLGLPKVDGFRVLDVMRDSPELREIPVVVFTQSRDEQDVVQSYEFGACSFVTKPMHAERFEELVRGFSIYWDAIRQVRDE